MYFVNFVAMLFRVELTAFFGVVFRWCAVLEFEVMSTRRLAVAASLAFLGAMEPHGRKADGQLAPPAQRFAVAGGRDMDPNLPRGFNMVKWFYFSEVFGACLCINEPVFCLFTPPTGGDGTTKQIE